jgi:hypothetical protein
MSKHNSNKNSFETPQQINKYNSKKFMTTHPYRSNSFRFRNYDNRNNNYFRSDKRNREEYPKSNRSRSPRRLSDSNQSKL